MLTVINHFEIKSQRILFTNFSHLLEEKKLISVLLINT